MPMDTMDFAFATRVYKVAKKHVMRGTGLHESWVDVVKAAGPAIGPVVTKVALRLPIERGLVTCTSEYAALLARDNGGAAKNVNGLWFGLAELGDGDYPDDAIWTPYIGGSEKFNPKNDDWPCDLAWSPEDKWAVNESMVILSQLRAKHKRRAWYIDTCLIELLHMIYVAQFARACSLGILLGESKSRGIGCGFDSGDLRTLGIVDEEGFKPMK